MLYDGSTPGANHAATALGALTLIAWSGLTASSLSQQRFDVHALHRSQRFKRATLLFTCYGIIW